MRREDRVQTVSLGRPEEKDILRIYRYTDLTLYLYTEEDYISVYMNTISTEYIWREEVNSSIWPA